MQVPSCEDTARGRRKSLAARPSLDEGKALNPNFELQRSLSESKLTLLDLLAEHQAKAAPRAPSQRAARPYEHKHYIARVSAARGLTAGMPLSCCRRSHHCLLLHHQHVVSSYICSLLADQQAKANLPAIRQSEACLYERKHKAVRDSDFKMLSKQWRGERGS